MRFELIHQLALPVQFGTVAGNFATRTTREQSNAVEQSHVADRRLSSAMVTAPGSPGVILRAIR